MYKNSSLWLDRHIDCLNDILKNKPNNIKYDINVVYGDSTDGTDDRIKEYMNKLSKKYKHTNINIIHFPLPRRLNLIEKLAILRNVGIIINKIDNYKYILHIDTDVLFNNLVVQSLLKHMNNDNKIGIMSPLIFIENDDVTNTDQHSIFYDTWAFRIDNKMFTSFYPYIPKEILKKNPNFLNNNQTINNEKIIEVDSVGSFYICRADIFSKYKVNYSTIKDSAKIGQHTHRKYESEQVCFCNDVKKITNYKICVDYNINVKHVNLEKYGLEWH